MKSMGAWNGLSVSPAPAGVCSKRSRAIRGHVLDDAEELALGLERLPHQAEHAARHVRMAHDVVLLPQQRMLGKVTDAHEGPVHISEPACGVGLADDHVVVGDRDFPLCRCDPAFHCPFPRC